MWGDYFHYQSRPAIIYGNCTQVCHCNHHFKFGPFLINEVLVYKYLGVDLDYRLIFGEFKNKILAKAKVTYPVFGTWELKKVYYLSRLVLIYIKH